MMKALVVLMAGFSMSALGEHEGRFQRAEAEPNTRNRITGCAEKNNVGEAVQFGLSLGNDFSQYQMSGSSEPDQGLYETATDYSGITVKKVRNENGLTRITPIDNRGTLKFFPRKRKLGQAVLAGVPLSGHTVAKMFTNSLTMDELAVDGKAAKGKLFRNMFTGSYSCPAGSCSFGPYAIRSSEPGSKVVFNYDNFINTNRMRVSLKFGDLVLEGTIKFKDTTRTVRIDEDSSYEKVTATEGCFNVDVKKTDGSSLKLAAYGEKETEDDKTARHLMAWLQLMTYDLFSK